MSSPEQLDQLMQVVSPLGWLALLPLLGLIVIAVMWGWFGSIPTKVFGKCLIINPVGLAGVTSATGEKGGLQAVIYVPAADGPKVQTKMAAQVTPSTVKREEFGFMFAEVAYVSDYPATAQSMMLLLRNETLVKELAGNTPPTEIRAALIPADNFSGYRWTSPAGPPVRVKSGTLCTAEIVVDQQRPLSLVIPALKKSVGVD